MANIPLFGQGQVRSQDGALFRGDGGDIDRIADLAAQEGLDNILGDIDGDIDLGFFSGGAEVGGADDIIPMDQGIVGFGGLGFIHIQGGPGDFPAFQSTQQRGFFHDPAPGAVDDPYALLHFGYGFVIDQVGGFLGLGGMEGDEIGIAEDIIQGGRGKTHLLDAIFGSEGIVT